MATVFEEIKRHLDPATDCNHEAIELLNADVQQAKEAIQGSFSKAMECMRMREQLLLQNVDDLHESIAHTFQNNSKRAAEVRGKLKTFIDLSKFFDKEESLLSLADKNLRESLQLSTQEKTYEQGCISFVCDENHLLKTIRQYGRIVNTSSHSNTEGSERSWEFAGSDVMSYASENFEAVKRTESPCHGVCTGSTFEIEDIDKHFGITSEKPFMTLSQFCKANEVCHSIKDCLFDEPCCNTSSGDTKEPSNVYAATILADMNEIGNPEEAQKYLPESLEDHSDFQRTISNLSEQFQNIIEDGCHNAPLKQCNYTAETAAPCSVESLAGQIDRIINGASCERRPEPNFTPSPVSQLASEINAIINSGSDDIQTDFVTLDLSDEVKKLNLDSSEASKLPKHLSSLDDQSPSKFKQAFVEMKEKQDSEKMQEDFDDFAYLENISGSTTLMDLNSTLLGIIDS